MGVKDSNYQIVYRGEVLDHLIPSQWVFFQRLKSYGGGYWLGRTYQDFLSVWPGATCIVISGITVHYGL